MEDSGKHVQAGVDFVESRRTNVIVTDAEGEDEILLDAPLILGIEPVPVDFLVL